MSVPLPLSRSLCLSHSASLPLSLCLRVSVSVSPKVARLPGSASPAIGQGGAADGAEGAGVKGGGGGTAGVLARAVNTVMKPSHSRLGRSAVYIRYVHDVGGDVGGRDQAGRFVDAVFSLQVPRAVL